MTKSDRLKPVVRVAQDRERNAAQILAGSQRQLADRQRRLTELEAYRVEYETNFTRANRNSHSALAMADYHAFIARLDQVIVEQKRLVAAAAQDVEEKRQAWQATRTKSMALDKAVERFRGQEQHRQERAEQKETDDRSQHQKVDEETKAT